MKHRALFVVAVVVFAGCLGTTGAPSDPASPTPTRMETDTKTPEPERIENNKTVRIGSPSDLNDSQLRLDTQSVQIRNTGSSEQVISLTLSNVTSEGPVFNQTHTFAANATLEVTIYEPGNYSGTIRTNSDQEVFDLPAFDCNIVGAGTEVAEDGSIDTTIGSTLVGCPSISEPNETAHNKTSIDQQ